MRKNKKFPRACADTCSAPLAGCGKVPRCDSEGFFLPLLGRWRTKKYSGALKSEFVRRSCNVRAASVRGIKNDEKVKF